MSQSLPTLVLHRDVEYTFKCAEKIFEPGIIGLRRSGASTACWAGWHPTYEISSGRFYLRDLTIYADIERLPVVCRVPPEEIHPGFCRYKELFLPLGLSGELSLTVPCSGDYALAPIDETARVPSFRLRFETGLVVGVENLTFVEKVDSSQEWPDCAVRVPVAIGEPTPFDDEVVQL